MRATRDPESRIRCTAASSSSCPGTRKGGKADPKSQAEFRGTLFSRDTDSIVRGFVKFTDGTGAVSLKTMTITYDPKAPDRISVVGPNVSGVKQRAN
jgi:hypothetical protein